MAKVQVHTKRILPILGFISCILVFYIFIYNEKIDIRERIILQRMVASSLKNTDKYYKYLKLHGSSHLACVQPVLKVNDSALQRYFLENDSLKCDEEPEWVIVSGNQAKISDNAKKIHGSIECSFAELLFKNDDVTELGQKKFTRGIFEFTRSDFYDVECEAADGKRWKNTISGICRNKIEFNKKILSSNDVHFNVLLLGFDSLSHTNFIRTLPKTYRYIEKELQSYVLEGYNIVGDGTPSALIPILTGKTELELPETRKRMEGKAKYVDVYPMVWKDFKSKGYVTLFAEDQPLVGTFNYRLKGFSRPPTDHYMRTFYNYVFPLYKYHPQYCLRGTPRHKVFLNYVKSFFQVYKEVPKFAFAFHGELSHDDYNLISVADEDILEFLKFLNIEGYLKNTAIFMFSDHGNRFSAIRETQEGKQEERLPFISVYLPKKLKELYPSAADNVRVNTKRLSTPFDIYPTLKDFIVFSGAKLGKTSERAISLFSEIPPSRTCGDAFIEPHWCTCLTWEAIPITNDKVLEAAAALVHYINSYTAPSRAYCHEIKLYSINWSALLLPNEGVLKFKHAKDYDGFIPDMSSNTAVSEEVYQISIMTTPIKKFFWTSSDFPKYEASLTYNIKQDSFSVKMEDVSRINKYGDQPHCIVKSNPELRKFCYCIEPP